MLPRGRRARRTNAAINLQIRQPTDISAIIIGEGISGARTGSEERGGRTIGDILLRVEADGTIVVDVGAGMAVVEEGNVAAGDGFASRCTGYGEGVAVYVADVDVWGAGVAGFDLAVCVVDRLSDVDAACPAGREGELGAGSSKLTGGEWSADGTGTTSVVVECKGDGRAEFVGDADGQQGGALFEATAGYERPRSDFGSAWLAKDKITGDEGRGHKGKKRGNGGLHDVLRDSW